MHPLRLVWPFVGPLPGKEGVMAGKAGWMHESPTTLQRSEVDFFRVSPVRYWFDFLLSLVLAYGLGAIYLMAPLGSIWQLAAYPLALFWIYRLGSLVHE